MFQNEKGISLVQVVVAAGILSGLFLAMMKMQTDSMKTQKGVQANMEIDRFVTSLNSYLAKSDICEKSMSGVNVLEEPALVKSIKKANGNNRYEWNTNYGNNSFKITRMYIDDFSKDGPDKDTGVATLVVEIDKVGKVYGNDKVRRELEIYASIKSNGDIVECQSMSAGGGFKPGQKIDGLSQGDIQKAVTGKATGGQNAAKVKEIIKNNPMLQNLQNTMKSLKQTNEMMKDSNDGWEEETPPENENGESD